MLFVFLFIPAFYRSSIDNILSDIPEKAVFTSSKLSAGIYKTTTYI